MMRHGRACLLLWGRTVDTVVDIRTTRCHKFIQVGVITMLLGDIGREAGGTFARHRPHMAICVKVISAVHAWGRHRQQ